MNGQRKQARKARTGHRTAIATEALRSPFSAPGEPAEKLVLQNGGIPRLNRESALDSSISYRALPEPALPGSLSY